MALFTYDGDYAAVDLRVAGHDLGTVEKGGSIVVPDELASLTEWPDYWKRADEPKTEQKPVTVKQNEKEGK